MNGLNDINYIMDALDRMSYFRQLRDRLDCEKSFIGLEVSEIAFYGCHKKIAKISGVWREITQYGDGFLQVPFPLSMRGFLHINVSDYYDWVLGQETSSIPF